MYRLLKKKLPTSRLQVFGNYVYWDGFPVARIEEGSSNGPAVRSFEAAVLDLDKAIQLREELTNLYTELKLSVENFHKLVAGLTRAEAGTDEHNPFLPND